MFGHLPLLKATATPPLPLNVPIITGRRQRYPKPLCGLLLGFLTTSVIASYHVSRGMPRDIGDGHHIHLGVEQIGDTCAPNIMRSEVVNGCLVAAFGEQVVDRLIGDSKIRFNG